jgi:hypothetical protein
VDLIAKGELTQSNLCKTPFGQDFAKCSDKIFLLPPGMDQRTCSHPFFDRSAFISMAVESLRFERALHLFIPYIGRFLGRHAGSNSFDRETSQSTSRHEAEEPAETLKGMLMNEPCVGTVMKFIASGYQRMPWRPAHKAVV